LAPGQADRPWAYTDSATVQVTTVSINERSGSWVCSTRTSTNTIEASPRGPNQPRNPTVTQRIPMPSMARPTGSIRTTVRLATAYSATRQSSSPRAGPSSTAPNSGKVMALSSSPDCSAKKVLCSARSPAAAPKTIPATKAAMNPDLLQDHLQGFDAADALLGLGDGEDDDQQGYAYAVIQAAFDVEALPDAGGQPLVADHRQPEGGVCGGKDGGEGSGGPQVQLGEQGQAGQGADHDGEWQADAEQPGRQGGLAFYPWHHSRRGPVR